MVCKQANYRMLPTNKTSWMLKTIPKRNSCWQGNVTMLLLCNSGVKRAKVWFFLKWLAMKPIYYWKFTIWFSGYVMNCTCFKVNLMDQSENSKVPENWDNSWHGVMKDSGISIKPLYNHRPGTMWSMKYSQTPLIRTVRGHWKCPY